MQYLFDKSHVDDVGLQDCYYRDSCTIACDFECEHCEFYYPFANFDHVIEQEYYDNLKERAKQTWDDLCEYD